MALVADETKVNQVLKPKNMLRPMVLLFVAYLVLAYGSQLLMIPGMNLISICFPVGLCFAALQSYGWRVLPVLIIGNLCSAFLLDNQSLLICAAGTLAAVCAKSCLSHMNPHIIKLEQAKHIFQFGVIAMLATAIASVFYALAITPWFIDMHVSLWVYLLLIWCSLSTGMILVAPIALLLMRKDGRCLALGIATVVSLLLVATFLELYHVNFTNKQRLIFEDKSIRYKNEIESHISSYIDNLYAIRSYYLGSSFVDRQEFAIFVKTSLQRFPGIQALEWIPKISHAERRQHERNVQKEGYSNYVIKERGEDGYMVSALVRDVYYPVTYVEPFEKNKKAFGFDLGSNPARKQALMQARDSGSVCATAPITLVQETGEAFGFLVFMPIYKGEVENQQQRQEQLHGFALGVFRVDTILNVIVADHSLRDINVVIHDVGNGEDPVNIYGQPLDNSVWMKGVELNVGGRTWRVEFRYDGRKLISNAQSPAIFSSLGALFFALALICFPLIVTGQHFAVRRQVAEQTREIKENQLQLRQMVVNLTDSNKDLEQFAYVASHDLKSPLRAISSLANFIQEDLGEVDSEIKEHFDLMLGRIKRMERLLDDLLQYSRASRVEVEAGNIEAYEVVSDIVNLLNVPDGFSVSLDDSLKQLAIPRVPLEQVIRNIINNAIKHHDKSQGHIIVGGAIQDAMIRMYIRDDGPGIAEEYQQRVFEMFKTLRPRDEVEGSGMGLALVQRIVHRFGGKVGINSDGQRGSELWFTWPLEIKTQP